MSMNAWVYLEDETESLYNHCILRKTFPFVFLIHGRTFNHFNCNDIVTFPFCQNVWLVGGCRMSIATENDSKIT